MNKPNFDRPKVDKKYAQVFIATTKGLVQVQSITRLTASDLSSVATISGTSQLAGISGGYQAFVEKPQGIITDVFGGHAYRLNLSDSIDQGESWQLGVFIAHYLFEHGCLSEGASKETCGADPVSDDMVIIATGKIDTLLYTVLPIQSLAKKCLLANSPIDEWKAQQKRVCFLAPNINFREPVPDTAVNLTPISALPELFQLCSMFGLPVGDLVFSKEIDANLKNEGALIEADFLPTDTQYPLDRKRILAPNKPLINSPSIRTLFVLSLLLFALSLFIIKVVNVNSVSGLNRPVVFALMGSLSDNKKSCGQGGLSILDKGLLVNKLLLNPTNIAHLCQLYLVTDTHVSSLWLVTDTKAIFPLRSLAPAEKRLNTFLANSELLADIAEPLQWSLPLPSNQSQTRKYTLLAFTQPSDAADIDALESYLYQFQQTGRSHNIEDLQTWINKTQADNKIVMLEHELTVQK